MDWLQRQCQLHMNDSCHFFYLICLTPVPQLYLLINKIQPHNVALALIKNTHQVPSDSIVKYLSSSNLQFLQRSQMSSEKQILFFYFLFLMKCSVRGAWRLVDSMFSAPIPHWSYLCSLFYATCCLPFQALSNMQLDVFRWARAHRCQLFTGFPVPICLFQSFANPSPCNLCEHSLLVFVLYLIVFHQIYNQGCLLHAWRPSTGKYVPTLCQANDASHLSLISLWTHERMFSFFFFSFFFSFFGQRIVFISYGLITSFECFSLSLCNLHCPKSFVFSSDFIFFQICCQEMCIRHVYKN